MNIHILLRQLIALFQGTKHHVRHVLLMKSDVWLAKVGCLMFKLPNVTIPTQEMAQPIFLIYPEQNKKLNIKIRKYINL